MSRIPPSVEFAQVMSAEELLPQSYDELRQLAKRILRRERPGHLLHATALVHEAYLRLMDAEIVRRFESRQHFMATIAEIMRHILVDQARHKHRIKHGGGHQRLELTETDLVSDDRVTDVLKIDSAVDSLAAKDPRAAELVKLRFFMGLTIADAATALGISDRTANRLWIYAKVWLQNELASK
jgi:RNA polymerase sigma factor (TIGR02999 family)